MTHTLAAAGLDVAVALATPPGEIYQVLATYTTGDGHWLSLPLVWKPATGQWTITLPRATIAFLIQAVDTSGNVVADTNGGRYYSVERQYLPLIAGRP